jgi:uncharacterized protein (DUF2235 family)
MSKNIVICSDGTGNTAIKGRGTNVFKLFEAVDLNGHRWDAGLQPQVAIYDDGVGSGSFKPLKVLGGAAGLGLSRNVRQLYKELARVYDPGDSIYVFGFSRGAFTVRTLIGMVATCGLIDVRKAATSYELERLAKEAYRVYRRCYRSVLSQLVRGMPDRNLSEAFRQEYAIENQTRIRFVGVWDTVDAVGLPFHVSDLINSTIYRFKFPDTFLSEIVDKACHALSLDDERQAFHPLVWNEAREAPGSDRIEQVWFAGVHANVGGGYPKQGMSLVALDWMMERAEAVGLRFTAHAREHVRHGASVDDMLYDSRAGLNTFYRWRPRDIGKICDTNAMRPARLHVTVLERIAHGIDDYAPANLPHDAMLVATEPTMGRGVLANLRAANLERELKLALPAQSLLERLQAPILVGWLSYYVFLATLLGTLVSIALLTAETTAPVDLGRSVASLIGGLLSSPVQTGWFVVNTLAAHPAVVSTLLTALALSSLMARFADRHISRTSSQLWYAHQQNLRRALQLARRGELPVPAPGTIASRPASGEPAV